MNKCWKPNLAMIMAMVAACLFSTPATAEPKKPDQAAASCVQTAKGPLTTPTAPDKGTAQVAPAPEILARVGKPAPDFEANAFIDGQFKNLKLSDYKNKWVVLCFYPGDFTFV